MVNRLVMQVRKYSKNCLTKSGLQRKKRQDASKVWMEVRKQARSQDTGRTWELSSFHEASELQPLWKGLPEIFQSLQVCSKTTGMKQSLLGSLWNSLFASPWGVGYSWIGVPGLFSEHKPWPSLGMWQPCSQLLFTKPKRQNSWLRPIINLAQCQALCRRTGSGDQLNRANSVLLRKQLLQGR